MKDTQNKRLIRHLIEHKKITSLEAINRFGITRLSARIYDLKQQGYIFECKPIIVKNRYGEKVRVTEYKLIEIKDF